MKEQFVNEFISSLSGDFDKDILRNQAGILGYL